MAKKYFKKNLVRKQKRIRNIITIILLIACIVYYSFNKLIDSSLHDFVGDNLIIQAIFLFGALYTLLSLFFNLSFTKQLNDKDVIEIMEQKREDDERLEQIKKDATIG